MKVFITWRIESVPPGATVTRLGSRDSLGITPFVNQVERGSVLQTFVLRLPGHRDARVQLDARADIERRITLVPLPAPRAKPRPAGMDRPLPGRLDSFDDHDKPPPRRLESFEKPQNR